MKLTAKHLELYKKVSERGEGRGSSDLNPDEVKLLTPDQWKEMAKAFHDWNGDPEEFLEYSNYVLPDFCVLGYLRFLILDEVKKQLPKPPVKYRVVMALIGRYATEIEADSADQAREMAMTVLSTLISPTVNINVKVHDVQVTEIED
jgi:hypothetical protein